jgi:pimeloyl-ACP methyl ester carboxylesterase
MTRICGLLMVVLLLGSAAAQERSSIWTVLAADAKGDERDPALPDGAQLSYQYDPQTDLLSFRVTLYGTVPARAFGVNLVIDTGDTNSEKANWWGANKDFQFDRLVTAWVTRRGNGYDGTVGIADAAGARAKNLTNLHQGDILIRVEGDSIILGVKRATVTTGMKMKLIAAVGSEERWNDDIPSMRSATLDLTASRPARGLREIDLSRNNFRLPTGYRVLPGNQPPQVRKQGHGRTTFILIPGVYSGKTVFDRFVADHENEYTFYTITPPGLNGTNARALPSETISYGDLPWTRRLASDVLYLIHKEHLSKPIIMVHGFPGSLAVTEVAFHNPEIVAGIIELASTSVQPYPSWKDPTMKTQASPADRADSVDKGWAQKWFKYVTPETWESNNYSAQMFSNDPDRAEQVRKEIEITPLPVKIRYLAEFMASDQSAQLAELKVPVLVLRPGFNQKVLSELTNSWFKMLFLNPWDTFTKNPMIRVVTVENARALIFDDQPASAENAIDNFVGSVVK